MPAKDRPHRDTLDAALPHYEATFRHRYQLPSTTRAVLEQFDELTELLSRLDEVRREGVADASCALIARIVLSLVPRYTVGWVDGQGRIVPMLSHDGMPASYRSRHVVLFNPLGGRNNWASTAKWVRGANDRIRRSELAGLASERRPDDDANWDLLDRARAEHGRAVVLPPDEGFSASRAAEVSYIYGIPIETLRDWRRRYRAEIGSKKPGAPRNR